TLREVGKLAGLTEFHVGACVLALRSDGSASEVSRGEERRPDRQEVTQEHRACALRLFHAGLYKYAKRSFEYVLGGQPRDSGALFHMALLKAEAGMLDGAVRGLEPLLRDGEIGRIARLNLAVLAARAGDLD